MPGPNAGKQVRGGLRGSQQHQTTGQASAAAAFTAKVGLKIVFDLVGLAMLAAPEGFLPAGLPRTTGMVGRCRLTLSNPRLQRLERSA
jgi:hypothetical protein